MAMVTVNYSLNQAYFVDRSAFEKMIKKAASNSKLIKVKESNVIVSETKNDFRVELRILTKKGTSFKDAIESFTKQLDNYSLNLIDSKPENVTLIIEGEF